MENRTTPPSTPSLARRYICKLLANVASVPVYLAMEAILPRALGPAMYGNYSFATNFFQQLFMFLDMGTSTCFYNALSRRQSETGLISFYMRLSLLIAVISLLIAAAMQEQTGGFMWTITDAKSQKGANFGSKLSAGLVREARSLTALAHDIGISIERLSFTMNSYNRMVALGKDPRFGRTTFLQTIDTPPFYYGIERLCVHITMGGLLIDADARVLDRMNAPVPGLFAAGETTGGVHGRKRLGGNALTDAFVFGRIAGAGAARLALGRCPPGRISPHSIRTGSRAPA